MIAALAALLVLSVWSLFRTGLDLDRVCELTGPHEISHEHSVTPRQEIDTLCLDHASDDDDD
jgi:hypothetical protein